MTSRIDQLAKIQNEARDLFEKKNKDYGDAFASYGPIGVLVRIGDKIRRLQSITKTGVTMIADERMRDSLIDLHNYAAMAVLLLDEETPQSEDPPDATVLSEAGVGVMTLSDLKKNT
jgi:hypothetical protein